MSTQATADQDLRPEAELLLICARSQIDGARRIRLDRLLRGPLDWDFIVRKANWHGLLPLLYWNLRGSDRQMVPPDLWVRLEGFFHANTKRCMMLSGELAKILDHFSGRGIRACPFKGPLLATEFYGHIGLRSFGDLDILVPRWDMERAIEALIELGYAQPSTREGTECAGGESADPETIGYLQPHFYTLTRRSTNQSWGNIRVDLQWRISDTHFAFKLDSDARWLQLVQVPLLNRQVTNFPLDDLFLILSVHGCKHYWYRIKWICDIAEILRSNPNHDWRPCLTMAKTLGVERMIRLGVFLANQLLNAPIPRELVNRIENDNRMRAKAHWIRQRLFAENDGRINEKQAFFFYLDMKDHWSHRLKHCLLYVQQFFVAGITPTEIDREAIPLPKSLQFLYYVIRPVRVGAKHAIFAFYRFRNLIIDRREIPTD